MDQAPTASVSTETETTSTIEMDTESTQVLPQIGASKSPEPVDSAEKLPIDVAQPTEKHNPVDIPNETVGVDASNIASEAFDVPASITEVTTSAKTTPVPSSDIAADTASTSDGMDVEIIATEVIKPAATDKPTIDPAPVVTGASSLGLLADYGSSESEAEDGDGEAVVEVSPAHVEATEKLNRFLKAGDYREISDSSEEDDDDDEDSDDSDDDVVVGERTVLVSDDDDSDVEHVPGKKREPVKARGEMGIDDLPPIEDLKISVPEDECVLLGKISGIVEQLVLVEASRTGNNASAKPLDLETVLFLDHGRTTLGRVFDVLGQISEPLYCVRFNTNQEIIDRGIQVGQPVYLAPDRSEHTQYIVLGNLMRERGCDASWEHDIEAPDRFVEYSDDEDERNARKVRRGKKSATDAAAAGASSDGGDAPTAGASFEGRKRHRNAEGDGGSDSRRSYGQQQVPPNQGGGRFQRGGGGRGGQAGGARGAFRGQPQRGGPPPHHGGMHHGQQPQQQQWLPHENYSWHTNLPYNAGAVQPQQAAAYYAPPPPILMAPQQQPPNPYYAPPYAYGPPAPAPYGAPMYGAPMHPGQQPPQQQHYGPPVQQQPPQPMYQPHPQQHHQHGPKPPGRY